MFGGKIRKNKEESSSGPFIFLGFRLNAAALVTECCGIGFSGLKQIFQKWSNAAALGSECRGIEGFDFKIFSRVI